MTLPALRRRGLLLALAGLMYAVKRTVWADKH